jgi:hypothetical protein
MARLLLATAQITGRKGYTTLDAYFAVGPTFLIFKEQINEPDVPHVKKIRASWENIVEKIPTLLCLGWLKNSTLLEYG